MGRIVITCFYFFIIMTFNSLSYAKIGHDNIIFLIDISGSTQQESFGKKPFLSFIEIVQKLFDTYIVSGDYVKFIAFSTNVRELTPGQIIASEKADENAIIRILRNFDNQYKDNYKKGDSRIQYTDIGLALEKVADFIIENQPGSPANRNLILLLTDGKHEARPGSKYSVSGNKLKALLKDAGKSILNGSWDIRCFGLGNNANIDLIASVLNDPDPLVTSDPNAIVSSIGKIIQDKVELTYGVSSISLSPSIFMSYRQEKEIELELINRSNLNKRLEINLKGSSFINNRDMAWNFKLISIVPNIINLKPGEQQVIKIILYQKTARTILQKNGLAGNINFLFNSGVRFYPSIVPVNVTALSWFITWKWYIFIFSPILLIITFLISKKLIYGKKPIIRISLLCDGKSTSDVIEKIKKGKSFIIGDDGFSIPGLKRGHAITAKYLGNNNFELIPENNIMIEMNGVKKSEPCSYKTGRMQEFSIIDNSRGDSRIVRRVEIVEGSGINRSMPHSFDDFDEDSPF